MSEIIRHISILAWLGALIVFLPGAIRAIRDTGTELDLLWLALCFSFLNRIAFSLTAIFAPDLTIVSQAMGLAAAIWVGLVGYRLMRHG